jgi:hypothetical protein
VIGSNRELPILTILVSDRNESTNFTVAFSCWRCVSDTRETETFPVS